MGGMLGVAHLLARTHASPAKGHVPLESIRGFLASGVFFCHAVVTYFYLTTGEWGAPPSAVFSYLGSGAVDIFFFLSGYLFWSKCLAQGGIGDRKRYFAARVRRIVPAYYASLLLVCGIVAALSGFALHEPVIALAGQCLGWLAFGFPAIAPPLNGVENAPLINAAVLWTLQLEIVFYLLLPVLFPLFRGKRLGLYIGGLGLVYWQLSNQLPPADAAGESGLLIAVFLARFLAFGFGFGMLVAQIMPALPRRWLQELKAPTWGCVALGFLASPVALGVGPHSFAEFLLLLTPFVIIVAGNDLFGLLSMKSSLLLGQSSYSLYVTHGIVLFALSQSVNRWFSFEHFRPVDFWLFTAVAGATAVCLSVVMYKRIEEPFMSRPAERPAQPERRLAA
jgi:peptidoglycan/LPS O-acetylase OafA/YrhL